MREAVITIEDIKKNIKSVSLKILERENFPASKVGNVILMLVLNKYLKRNTKEEVYFYKPDQK